MSGPLLAPLGRAEPDDVQGWIELGGLFRLQLALAAAPADLRQRLGLAAGRLAALGLSIGRSPDPTRTLVEELPAWLVEGALYLAIAREQRDVMLHLGGALPDHVRLLDGVIAEFDRLGITGDRGLARRIEVHRIDAPAPVDALDALDARRLALRVADEESATTLATLSGAVARPRVIELRLDRPLAEQLGRLSEQVRLVVDGRRIPVRDGTPLGDLVRDGWRGRIEIVLLDEKGGAVTGNGTGSEARHQALIEDLGRLRAKALQRLSDADDRMVVYGDGGWRIQDVLGHVAAWERETLAALQAFIEGDRYSLGEDYDNERYNQEAYERRRDHYPEQCRIEWAMVRRDLIEALRSLPPDALDAEIDFPWGHSGTVEEMVRDILGHEYYHLKHIYAALGEHQGGATS